LCYLESIKLEVMSATIHNMTCKLGQDPQPSGSKTRSNLIAKNFANSVLLHRTPNLPFMSKIPKATSLVPSLSVFVVSTLDTSSVTVPKTRHQQAFRCTCVTSMANSPSAVIFCVTFQLNSAKRHCKTDHPSQHACLWCSSSDHGACAQKCL
jgi:hypothetical protein